jgi:hypothetical protein
MARGRAVVIVLDKAEQRELTALTRKHGAPQASAERAHCAGRGGRSQEQGDRGAGRRVQAYRRGTGRNRFAERRPRDTVSELPKTVSCPDGLDNPRV